MLRTLNLRRRLGQCVVTLGLVAALALPATTTASAEPAAPSPSPGALHSQNLAADRTDANYFYRIPALTHLGDGVVLAAWDARPGSSADAPNPNSIMQRRSEDNGVTWSAPVIIAAGQTSAPRFGYSDPSYVTDRETGRVFMFFVFSKDQGWPGSQYGNDDEDRQVMSSAVIHSDDGGLTWSEPRLITDVTKPATGTGSGAGYVPVPGDVRANFATSGEGIQLRYGPHAGRLLQQYAAQVRQPNGTEVIQAYSVYSDDHGATWQRGQFVGAAMDENKVVELSDGTLLLNSRDSANGRFRKVATSTDGGVTWGAVTQDLELPDPTNNASIIRLHPDAPAGSPEAQQLLFVNSNNGANGDRVNGAVRLSCDDGETWPGLRTLDTGFFAYASATILDEGLVGVLWERSYTNDMQFSTFDEAWLAAVCAPLTVPPVPIEDGTSETVPVTIENQEQAPLDGVVTIRVPSGWTASEAVVSDLAPGATTTVDVQVGAPVGATSVQAQVVFRTTDGRDSQTTTRLGVSSLGATVAISNTSPARDVAANPYQAGDQLSFSLRVTSTSQEVTTVTPGTSTFTSGFAPTACRWRNLSALGAYTCSTPRIQLSAADIERGWVVPEVQLLVSAAADASRTATIVQRGAPVLLRDGVLTASIAGTRADAGRDLAAQPYAVGEQVPYRFDVTNTSPVTIGVTPTAGAFAPFLPPGAGNCRYSGLPASGAYSCTTPRHTVTAADVERGFFDGSTQWSLTAPGQSAQVVATSAVEVDVLMRDPAVALELTASWQDGDGDGYAAVGDAVVWTSSVVNMGNVRLDAVRVDGADFGPLAVGERRDLPETRMSVTAADIAAGVVAAPGYEVVGMNGLRPAAISVEGSAFDLPVAPSWDGASVYVAGDRVTFAGSLWEASWWTSGQQPGDAVGPWQELRTDEQGRIVWTPSRIFTAGDVVMHDGSAFTAQWWTRGQRPGDVHGPWRVRP